MEYQMVSTRQTVCKSVGVESDQERPTPHIVSTDNRQWAARGAQQQSVSNN